MPPLAFDPPLVVDAARSGGEPVVLPLAREPEALLYAAHAGHTLAKRNRMPDPALVAPFTASTYLWRSADGGRSWDYVGLLGTGLGPHAPGAVGPSDPDLAEDAAGNLYTSGITLATTYVARSADGGRTWVANPAVAVYADREWLAADQENLVYLVANQLYRQLWWSRDGGLTWDPVGRVLPGSGPPSKPQVDRSTGALYVPDGEGSVSVFPRAREGDFTRVDTEVPGGTPHAFGHLVSLAVDRGGGVYLASNTRNEVWVSRSADGGRTWTTEVVHRAPGAIVLWPWVAAGAAGRVGVSWLQSDRDVGSPELAAAAYRVYAAQTVTGQGWTDACGVRRPPVWEVGVATPDPVHEGTICTSGLLCVLSGVDRRLGDYHTNAIAPDGRLVIAYATTTAAPESAVSRPGFVRQSAGTAR